jgi:hypothetical protein
MSPKLYWNTTSRLMLINTSPDNPRCSINSFMLKLGRLHKVDGKLRIYIQNGEPKLQTRAEWLPAPKEGSLLWSLPTFG